MRLLIALMLAGTGAYGQMCVPGRILPAGVLSDSLDVSNCQLSDGSAYASYRLNLPVRGRIQISLDAGKSDLVLILRDDADGFLASGATVQRFMEAGDYRLLVNARVPGGLGAYTIKTSFTAEPGMLCSNFSNLGLNQTLNGSLGVAGCLTPGGKPYDAYTVSTFGPGTLTVTVSGATFSPLLLFRFPDGRLMGSDPQSVSVKVLGDSQYQIAVTTGDTAGAYQITTSFLPATNATCLASKILSASVQGSGTISASSCTITYPGSGDLAFYNYFVVTVAAAGLADLKIASSDFTPTLTLQDSAGNLLSTDVEGDYSNSGTASAEIRMQLSPGTYIAAVYSDVLSGGSYNLKYDFTPGLPKACSASATQAARATGVLGYASCRTSLGLSDLYRWTLPTAGTLELTVTSDTFTPQLAILDAEENVVVSQQDRYGLGVAHLKADLPPGFYTIVPAAIYGAGPYQLAATFTPHDIPPCTTAYPLPLNGTYYQYLGGSGCKGANGQPVDLFQFTMPADGVVASVVASSDIDGFLTLLDSAGNVLRTDDNTYGTGDPLIVQFLPAGTYQLQPRAAQGTPGGPYLLALYAALGGRPPFCASRSGLTAGSSVKGNINSAGCQYTDSTLADIYRIDLNYDSTLDIRLVSEQFDAYLIILDENGNLVVRDDDSGGGTNARINQKMRAGTYYVVAKPSSDYFSQGDYTLTWN